MNELYELKEKLCRELKKYSSEEVTNNSLDVVKKLSAAVHYLDEIIEKYEEAEYSMRGSYGGSYESYGNSNRGNSNRNSYARGRGRNARRDSMGRYSSESYSRNGYSRSADVVEELREMMMDAPSDEIRREYEKVISRIESAM